MKTIFYLFIIGIGYGLCCMYSSRIIAFLMGMKEFRRMKTFRFAPLRRTDGDWSKYRIYQRGQAFMHWCTFGYWER